MPLFLAIINPLEVERAGMLFVYKMVWLKLGCTLLVLVSPVKKAERNKGKGNAKGGKGKFGLYSNRSQARLTWPLKGG